MPLEQMAADPRVEIGTVAYYVPPDAGLDHAEGVTLSLSITDRAGTTLLYTADYRPADGWDVTDEDGQHVADPGVEAALTRTAKAEWERMQSEDHAVVGL